MTPRATLAKIAALALLAAAAGCSTTPRLPQPAPGRAGGYYQDDGPPAVVPADLLATPDAVPRLEPFHAASLRPYVALGRSYTPIADDRPVVQRGRASWYGRKYHGSRTATGEIYDMFAMTAAHPTMPLPSYAQVTNLRNGAAVIVRVNDRGPFIDGRVIDLSFAAAMRLDIVGDGTAEVEVRRITQAEIAAGTAPGLAAPVASARVAVPASPATAAAAAPSADAPAGVAPAAGGRLAAATSAAAAPAAGSAAGGAAAAAGASVTPASVTPAPATAGGSPQAAARRWSVQLGAFRQEDSARAAQDESARQLAAQAPLAAELRSLRVERDGEWHRLLLGWLPDREAAEELAARLALLFGRDTAIVLR